MLGYKLGSQTGTLGHVERLHHVCNLALDAIIVGSEGRGVSDRLRAKAIDVRIPTVGVESLNAALAAGIALYAARKQRMVTP